MKTPLFPVLFLIALILMLPACASEPVSAAAPAVVEVSGPGSIDDVLRETSDYLNGRIPRGNKLVFLNFESEYPALSEYLIEGLIENTVNDGVFTVVDRVHIAQIQEEMNFQYSGHVSDETAQSLGRMLGAQTIVSGAVSPLGSVYRLRVRAISVETAEIQGQFNRDFSSDDRIVGLTSRREPVSSPPNSQMADSQPTVSQLANGQRASRSTERRGVVAGVTVHGGYLPCFNIDGMSEPTPYREYEKIAVVGYFENVYDKTYRILTVNDKHTTAHNDRLAVPVDARHKALFREIAPKSPYGYGNTTTQSYFCIFFLTKNSNGEYAIDDYVFYGGLIHEDAAKVYLNTVSQSVLEEWTGENYDR